MALEYAGALRNGDLYRIKVGRCFVTAITNPMPVITPTHPVQDMELQGMGTRQLAMLLDLLASHRLDPQIDQQRSWQHMGEMLAALGDRRIDGKAIAIVD